MTGHQFKPGDTVRVLAPLRLLIPYGWTDVTHGRTCTMLGYAAEDSTYVRAEFPDGVTRLLPVSDLELVTDVT